MRRPAVVLLLSLLAPGFAAGQTRQGTPLPPPAPAPRPARYSVAVLTFDNLGLDSADAFLTEALADAIATRLGQLDTLQVKRPRGLAPVRGAARLRRLGRLLNVNYIVEGSVQHRAARVRYSVRLERTNGVQVWALDYDGSTSDPLAVQADVASDVARGVIGRLLRPGDYRRLVAGSADPRAEQHYRHGNYLLGQRSASILRAIAEYDAALAVSPDYVPALALGAYARAQAAWWGRLPRDSALAAGFALADHALRLDSSSSVAWMARGMLLSTSDLRDQRPAALALERAVRLDPRNDEAWNLLAHQRAYLGRFAAADSALDSALALDPSRAISLVYRAELRHLARDLPGERRALDSAIILEPALLYAYEERALNGWRSGDTAAARRDAAVANMRGSTRLDLAVVRALLEQRPDSARRLLAAALDRLPSAGQMELMTTAVAAATLGDRDALIRIYGMVPAGHQRWYGSRFPVFDPYRSDPVLGPLLEAGRPTP